MRKKPFPVLPGVAIQSDGFVLQECFQYALQHANAVLDLHVKNETNEKGLLEALSFLWEVNRKLCAQKAEATAILPQQQYISPHVHFYIHYN